MTPSELRPNTALGSVCLHPWALTFLPFAVHLPEGFVKPFQGPYLIDFRMICEEGTVIILTVWVRRLREV